MYSHTSRTNLCLQNCNAGRKGAQLYEPHKLGPFRDPLWYLRPALLIYIMGRSRWGGDVGQEGRKSLQLTVLKKLKSLDLSPWLLTVVDTHCCCLISDYLKDHHHSLLSVTSEITDVVHPSTSQPKLPIPAASGCSMSAKNGLHVPWRGVRS